MFLIIITIAQFVIAFFAYDYCEKKLSGLNEK